MREGEPVTAPPVDPRLPAARRHVGFMLDGVQFAIPAERVRHSIPAREASGVAVVFLRHVYPLVDLRSLFRVAGDTPTDRLVLLLEAEERRAGVIVDHLTDLLLLDETTTVELPPVFRGVERRWFSGLARVGERIVVVVRPDGLLASRDVRLPPRLAVPTAAGR
jgi:chemotaxis signal transduction protein